MFESAFHPLHGFRFADVASRENALWLHYWVQVARLSQEAFRPPLVVITGPPGSGKTELARRALLSADGLLSDSIRVDAGCFCPALLDSVANAGSAGLLLDMDDELRLSKAEVVSLDLFLSNHVRHPSGAKASEVKAVRCVTIITADKGRLPECLSKRAVFINLLPPTAKFPTHRGEMIRREAIEADLLRPFQKNAREARTLADKAAKWNTAKRDKLRTASRVWKTAAGMVDEFLDIPF